MKTTLLTILIGWMLAAGAARAAHPYLAESPTNAFWHAPETAEEAVFVGDAKNTEPVVVLTKEPISRAPLAIRIYSDAKQCRIDCAGTALEFALEPEQSNTLVLDGTALRPTVKLNGGELMPVRGKWIQMFLRQVEPTLTLRLAGGTYATLRFSPAISPAPAAPAAPAAPVVPGKAIAPGGAEAPALPPLRVRAEDQPQAPIPGEHRELLTTIRPWDLSLRAGVDSVSAVFYRGIGRQNQDIMVEPWLDLDIRVYTGDQTSSSLLDAIDLQWGFRSIHLGGDSPVKLHQGEKWFEYDWYGGVSGTIFGRWTLGLQYVNLESIRTAFRDVHQAEAKLSFDDSDPNYSWSLQPYLLISYEFEHQSDAGWLTPANAVDPRFRRGIYAELGIDPTFPLFRMHRPERVTLSFPVAVGMSLSNYYEDPEGRGDTFGYVQAGPILEVPLASCAGPGNHRFVWKLRLGAQVLYLGNAARDLSRANGVTDSAWQMIGSGGLLLEF